MSSSSGSDSDDNSSATSQADQSEASKAQTVKTDADTKRIPPITERKLQLRNNLEMFQVDEEFEEEKYTVTGQTTGAEVVLPNIREFRGGAVGSVVKKSAKAKGLV